MPTQGNVLVQLAPAATTLTDLYRVNPGNQFSLASLFVCNRGGSSTTFRVAVAPNGEVDATKHYLYYDLSITANNTFQFDGLNLRANDVVRVYAGNTSLSFTLSGEEK